MYPHLRPKLYAIASGLGRGDAFRLAKLTLHLLRHSSAHVLSSGGWGEVDALIKMLTDAGYDGPRA
eukprot:5118240-Pyramimonas_sp.AAC.1